jgi:hypothetical protein
VSTEVERLSLTGERLPLTRPVEPAPPTNADPATGNDPATNADPATGNDRATNADPATGNDPATEPASERTGGVATATRSAALVRAATPPTTIAPARRPPVVLSPSTRLVPSVGSVTPTAEHGWERPFRIRRPDLRNANDRMLGLCGWAAGLGVAGSATALRGLLAILDGQVPDWYEPALAAAGLCLIGLVTAAFFSVRHPRLPWVMLAMATAPLLLSLGLTLDAL